MPRLYGVTLPAGYEVIYNKTLKMYDLAVNCNVGKNRRFLSRKLKLNLRDFTKLYQIATLWNALTSSEKDAWNLAGDAQGGTGYNLFTQDQIYRLQNGISGQATPSIYHQYFVSHVQLAGSANHARLHQYYNVPWADPATLDINYHSALTADGSDPYVRLTLTQTNYWGGKNNEKVSTHDFGLADAWGTFHLDFPATVGTKANWLLEITFHDVQGDFWFDDLFVQWGGELKNRDPFCDSAPKYWYLPDFPAGATLEAVYPLGAAL